MAVYRDLLGNIDKQEFENHLKAQTRKEGFIEILMYTINTNIQIANLITSDILSMSDITSLSNIDRYVSNTIATLEENLWLLNGRFITYQGGMIDGYISNSISDDNGDFTTNPSIRVNLSHTYDIEDFSIILNSAVPSGYPKDITVRCYDSSDTLLGTYKVYTEWQEDTGETDEHGDPIYQIKLLDTLPSVNFDIDKENVSYLTIEFGSTRFRHRRIRVSSIMFGKTLVFNQDDILNADYTDKTSYVCDTLPSRIFKFSINNYDGRYNIDNPENNYVNFDRRTRVRFRNGYNVCGYVYDENGHVVMENGYPVIDPEQDGVEIEWDNWKELRFMELTVDADENATFTAGSLLDIMEDTYTKEQYSGADRTVGEIAENILVFEGLDLNSIEWSSDGIKKPTYENGSLLPYEQWEDTSYNGYIVDTSMPEISCNQIIQLLAFTVGATLLIKDNGRIKFANLDLNDSTTFTNHYEWSYNDFESIPAAEQLESISTLNQISLPKYYSYLDETGNETATGQDGSVYTHCTVITTVSCNNVNTETSYDACYPIGGRIADDDTSGATLAYIEVYCRRGIITLGGYVPGTETKVEILGYPIKTKNIQERSTTSDSLVLDTQIMKYDVSKYNPNGSGAILESEQIKRKYLNWYKKKFKYSFNTRGEPLVNAGDYAIIQTQFTQQMPSYILQNHWTFDGTWSGDMEVIALD